MFLSCLSPRSTNFSFDPVAHLPVGVLRKTDRARLSDALQPRGDVDAVAHQIAVGSPRRRRRDGRRCGTRCAFSAHARVALDHPVLHFDRAAHRVDHAAELDHAPVAGALDHAAVVDCDRRVDEIAAQRPEPRQRAILVRAASRLKPTTSAARIAASFRVSLMAPSFE